MKELDKGISVFKKYAYQAKLWAVGVASFFATQQASATPKSGTDEKKSDNTEVTHKVTAKERFATFKLAGENKELKIGGVYKGLFMDFSQMEAPDIGHLFESGMNPYIMGGGKYLGLYQMDTGETMNAFLFGIKTKSGEYSFEGIAKDYPLLAKLGKTPAGRRSPEFVKMFGGLSKTQKFRHQMDKFMHDVKYKKVFDALRKIPDLDFDKRGEVFKGSVMSAINQNSRPSVICSIFSKALSAAKAKANKEKREVTTADIIKFSYDARKERWGLGDRYKEENRLCQDLLVFEQTMNNLRAAKREQDEKVKKLSSGLDIAKNSISIAKKPGLEVDALRVEISQNRTIINKKSTRESKVSEDSLKRAILMKKRGKSM